MRLPFILLSSIALLCAASGCAATAFSEARKADTPEAYRRFLRDYPRDDLAEPAQARLSALEFQRARALHTVLAYKRFLEEFPDSAEATGARALLEGLRFNAAREQGTAAALRQFLRDHPDGAHREEAQRLLTEAEFKEVSSVDDPRKLSRVLSEHPDDPRRAQTEARLDDAVFAEAKAEGAGRLLQYLDDFPAGAHREDARILLLSLKLDGLLFSGLIEEAQEEARRAPLAPRIPDLQARIAAARAERAALQSGEPLIQQARVGHYLRDLDDLLQALQAPDPLVRWQAAEELGQHVTVKVIDPLLSALRTARNPLIRQKALESLASVLRALPRPVADYEIALRLKALRGDGSSPDVWLAIAALLDLSGHLEAAATGYQKAFDPNLPDPVILRRWVQIRQERRQPFSAAVAARQLALWAQGVAREAALPEQGAVPLTLARQLCAAAWQARDASRAIALARKEKTEFPEDLAEFERQVEGARKLAEARLADAELLLKTQSPGVATCDDRQLSDRLLAGVAERGAALRTVSSRLPGLAPLVLKAARDKDPSFEIRAQATALLAAPPPAR